MGVTLIPLREAMVDGREWKGFWGPWKENRGCRLLEETAMVMIEEDRTRVGLEFCRKSLVGRP